MGLIILPEVSSLRQYLQFFRVHLLMKFLGGVDLTSLLQLQLLLKCNILQLLITFLAMVNVTLCQNVISHLLFSMSMFYNSCLILLNVCNMLIVLN